MNRPTQLSDIPASYAEQIRVAVASALALTGLTIVRERLHPVEQEALPVIGLYFQDVTPMGIGSDYQAPLVEREMELRCECRAIATTGTGANEVEVPPSQVLDRLLTWCTYGLFHDARFGGTVEQRLVNDIFEHETSPYSREADRPVASVSRVYKLKYRTSRLDPTSKG